MAAQPAARLCNVGKNLIKRRMPKVYPQWKLDVGQEITNVFENNSKVLVLHYNAMNSQEWNDFRYSMKQENIKVKIYPNRLTQVHLAKTIYSNLSPLFVTDTCIAYGDDINMSAILKHLNATPKVELIGAKIDNSLMNQSQIVTYSKLPSLEQLRAELVGILSSPAQKLTTLLETNQTNLSQSLTQYVKQSEDTTT